MSATEPRLEKLLSLITECSKWGLFTRPLTQNWGFRKDIAALRPQADIVVASCHWGLGRKASC